MSAIETFFAEYRIAFASFDRTAIAQRYTFPAHVVSATNEGPSISVFADENEFLGTLDMLLDAYRSLGVSDGVPLDFTATALSPQVYSVRVHWQLRREDASTVYEFTAIYTVAEVNGELRIAALAQDEIPNLLAAMAS